MLTSENDYEMYLKVFDLLADYGNPYNQDEALLRLDYHPEVYQIDVENATLYVDGSVWFSFPDF